LEDLAASQALITTAGNQLVGEALFLGKPVLAMPEKGNYEQHINAFYLKQSGLGTTVEMDMLTSERVKFFLNHFDIYQSNINSIRLCGNTTALRIINRYLPDFYYPGLWEIYQTFDRAVA